jgi:site-specific DNA-methyltransferase (adenine-specific)
MNKIILSDNLEALKGMEAESIDLVYIDPPFNTGKRQERTRIKTIQDDTGDRVGYVTVTGNL